MFRRPIAIAIPYTTSNSGCLIGHGLPLSGVILSIMLAATLLLACAPEEAPLLVSEETPTEQKEAPPEEENQEVTAASNNIVFYTDYRTKPSGLWTNGTTGSWTLDGDGNYCGLPGPEGDIHVAYLLNEQYRRVLLNPLNFSAEVKAQALGISNEGYEVGVFLIGYENGSVQFWLEGDELDSWACFAVSGKVPWCEKITTFDPTVTHTYRIDATSSGDGTVFYEGVVDGETIIVDSTNAVLAGETFVGTFGYGLNSLCLDRISVVNTAP